MAYLLDANVFIQAKNLHYGLDFCPAFWEWLIANNTGGSVFSIEKVGDEIAAGGDDLSNWAAQRGDGFFLKPDAALRALLPRPINFYAEVVERLKERSGVNSDWGIKDLRGKAVWLPREDRATDDVVL